MNFAFKTSLAAAVICASSAHAQQAPTNAIRAFPNPDFTALDGWRLTDDSKATATLSLDTKQFRGAPSSARLETQTIAKAAIQSELSAVPNGEISVSGQLKSAGEWKDSLVIFQSFDATWKQLDWKQFDVSTSAEWKPFSVNLTLPKDAKHVIFYLSSTGKGQLWLDDLEVKSDQAQVVQMATQIAQSAPVKLLAATPYNWTNAVMGGVEYATGYVSNPSHPSDLYLRADGGGIWKWNRAQNRWDALMDNLPFEWGNLQTADSLAVDPFKRGTLYVAGGSSRWSKPFDVLKTSDDGKSWTRTNLKNGRGEDVFSEGNGPDKQAGERLMCDPNAPDKLWFATRNDGLFFSNDGAKTWQSIAFPDSGAKWNGLTFVAFDARNLKKGEATRHLYVGVHAGKREDAGDSTSPGGIYQSTDGGKTWAKMAGGPMDGESPMRARVTNDGTLYISTVADGGGHIWKHAQGKWTDISPPDTKGAQWCALNLHPRDARTLVVSTTYSNRNAVWMSRDGGATWKKFGRDDNTLNWKTRPSWESVEPFPGNTSDVTFDPFDPTKLWLAAFQGPNRATVTPDKLDFELMGEGREQMTTADAVSPSSGAALVSGVWDVGGFHHESFDQIPQTRLVLLESDGTQHKEEWARSFQDTFDMDASPQLPDAIVAAGGWGWNHTGTGALSLDNGRTFRRFASQPFPGAMFGRVAMSACDPKNILWAPMGGDAAVYFSRDGGATWTQCANAPKGMINADGPWTFFKPIAADRALPNTFYIYDRRTGAFFASTDGGANWQQRATLPTQPGMHFDIHKLETSPTKAGELWLSLDEAGVLRSLDGGRSWAKMTGIERAVNISFGKGKTANTSSVFLLGRITGNPEIALYRSDDDGASWTPISNAAHRLANTGNLTGDNQTWGRVYAGTGTRGIFVGTMKGK